MYNSKACAFEQSCPYSPHGSHLTHSLSVYHEHDMSIVVSGRYFSDYKDIPVEPYSTLASATSEEGLAPAYSRDLELTGS